MTNRTVNVQAWSDHMVAPARDMAQGKHVFFNTPLNDAHGSCLDELMVPADVDFIINAYLVASVETPYDLSLMACLHDDDHIFYSIVPQEDVEELTRRTKTKG